LYAPEIPNTIVHFLGLNQTDWKQPFEQLNKHLASSIKKMNKYQGPGEHEQTNGREI